MSFRISAFASKEIQATILLLKGADRTIAKELRAQSKKVIQPVWQEAIKANAQTALEVRVLGDTARATVSDQNVTLTAGGIGKALRGGAKPLDIFHAVEFGADRDKEAGYSTHRKGTRYDIRARQTQRQFKRRNLKGYVAYPAAAEVIPRVASLWVQTVVRTFHEIIEGK